MHVGSVSIKNASHLDRQPMLPAIIEEQRLRASLAFIITGSQSDRIDVAPITFRLRVDCRISIDLGGRCLQDLSFNPLGKPQHVDSAMYADFGRLHWIKLIVNRGGGTSQIENLVNLDVQRKADIVSSELETWVREQMMNVTSCSRVKIVDAKHLVTACK